jgi:isoleucyl-tRNA synthetase
LKFYVFIELKRIQGDSALIPKSPTTNMVDDLRFIFLASQINIVDSSDDIPKEYSRISSESESGLNVSVTKANGKKCERCWYYSPNVGEHQHHDDLCLRCADVIEVDQHVMQIQSESVKA